MNESRNRIEPGIEKRLTEVMNHEKPPIGPRLAEYLADWNQWMGNRGASSCSSDWHLVFFKWALLGRAAEFWDWAKGQNTPEVQGALEGIRKVCRFNWPVRGGICQQIFRAHWGWLSVELNLPGFSQGLTLQEQLDALEKDAKSRGMRVKDTTVLGPCLYAELERM
jgi:hypothetical protein